MSGDGAPTRGAEGEGTDPQRGLAGRDAPAAGRDAPAGGSPETAAAGVAGTPSGPDGPARGRGRSERSKSQQRSGAKGNERRREVEAALIGLDRATGEDSSWWAPCWERGLDLELPPDRLFDTLATLHPGVRVLHGLGVGGTAMVIDHVLVGSGGVVVAGTEACAGRVRSDGVHLRVRGKDRSPMIDLALWRAEVIRTTLERRGIRDVPVHGVLHWQQLEGLGDRAICLRGVPLLSAGGAMGLAASGIDVSPHTIERIVAALAPATAHH